MAVLGAVYYLITLLLVLPLAAFAILVLLIIATVIYVKLAWESGTGVCKSNARLDGKTAIVTGGNVGIGLETARDLASRGATVVIASRNAKKSAEAIEDITSTTGSTKVSHISLDLAKFSSIRHFAEEFKRNHDRLDILVNNAGCAGLKPKITEDGIDVVMQINYFGPFLLTQLLLDPLIASKPSRIVNVSSQLHMFAKLDLSDLGGSRCKGSLVQYSNSKLCHVLWTKALAGRLPEGVVANVLHPGVVKTDIFERVYPWVKKILYPILAIVFKTPKEGAQTSIHLSVAEEVEDVSGQYFMECKPVATSKLSNDEDLIEKVWDQSLTLCGLKS